MVHCPLSALQSFGSIVTARCWKGNGEWAVESGPCLPGAPWPLLKSDRFGTILPSQHQAPIVVPVSIKKAPRAVRCVRTFNRTLCHYLIRYICEVIGRRQRSMPGSRLPQGSENVFQTIRARHAEAAVRGITLLHLSIVEPQGPALLSARAAEFFTLWILPSRALDIWERFRPGS